MPAPSTQPTERDTEEAHPDGVADDIAKERMEAADRLAEVKIAYEINRAELAQLRWERKKGHLATASELVEGELALEEELGEISRKASTTWAFRLDGNGETRTRRLPDLLDDICMLPVVSGWISSPQLLIDVPFVYMDTVGDTDAIVRAYAHVRDCIDPRKNPGSTEPWIRHLKKEFHLMLWLSWASYTSD
jgi:hypothetical protein